MQQPYIFNIGLGNSGTTSLTYALNILGIPSVHYIHGSRTLESIMLDNFSKNKRAFESLDTIYRGFSDFSGEFYLHQLYEQYPTAKFIFTIRSGESWVKSRRVMFENELSTNEPGYKRSTLESYNQRVEQVHKFFKDKPNNQFLEINIVNGDGWEKLCEFLEKPIPNVPFPHKNLHTFRNQASNLPGATAA